MKQHLVLLPLLTLAACGGGGPTPSLYCPHVAVLAEASHTTLFLPGRQDVAAQIAAASITGVSGACTLVPKKHLLRITYQTGFAATNGPANTAPAVTLPYFVSIVNDDAIITKSVYTITLAFNGNISTASATSKPITVELPNTPDSASTEILTGFQMTPAQLAYTAAHQ